MPSLLWSRVTGWARAEMGTVSDLFRLLGRICVFLLVACHPKCPMSVCMFQALVVGQGRSGADILSLYGAESPDGKGPRWARFLTCFASLVEFGCSFWFWDHDGGWDPNVSNMDHRGRHAITFWSRGTGWQRAEVGTVSDFFRLLGRICVFMLVPCHTKSPCACFKPL